MDQALKQRMVGATVLIALGVIFLPIFIGGGSSDQAVTTPNDEFLIPPQPQVGSGNGEPGRRLPLVQPAPATGNNDDSENPVDLSSGEIRLPLPNEALPDNGDPQSGDTMTDQPDNGAADNSADNLAGIDQSSTDPSTLDQPDISDDGETVAAVTPPEPDIPDTTENTSANNLAGSAAADSIDLENRWRVQVASLGNPDNAQRLIEQIESLGFPAQSQLITSNGISLHRILAGPFFNESEANVAVNGIRRADSRLNPQVLSPANAESSASADTASEPAPAAAGGLDRYAVQAGVFSSAENAEKLVQRLNNAGFAGYSERIDSDGQTLFRVRIGPLLSETDAGNIASRIENDLGIRGLVVDYP